jgi:hypothetical protein
MASSNGGDFELIDLEAELKSSGQRGVPGNAEDFLGLKEDQPKGPLAPLQGLFHRILKVLPGVEVVSGQEEVEKTREKLAHEAASIQRTPGPLAPPAPGDSLELEELLQPLVRQEVSELLNQEYGQEVLFVQWEKERNRSYLAGWAIAGFSAVLMLLVASTHAGSFIQHLLNNNTPLPKFLAENFSHETARGIDFVAGLLNVLLALLVFINSATALINSLFARAVRGVVMAGEGFVGLLIWLSLMNSSDYFLALTVLAVLFVVLWLTERVGR